MTNYVHDYFEARSIKINLMDKWSVFPLIGSEDRTGVDLS